MRKIAIYDMDGTVLRHSSFTPFLIFAARQDAVWRLALVPVWIGAMLGYRAEFWSRQALKQFGLRLFLGSGVTEERLSRLATAFADHVLPDWIAPGAAAAMAHDREEGRVMVLATAAMEFLAAELGGRLGFDHVLATRHRIAGRAHCRIDGLNCHDVEKLRRVEEWLSAQGLDRAECHIRFYSDSGVDAPLLDEADEGVMVGVAQREHRMATARGWRIDRFRD